MSMRKTIAAIAISAAMMTGCHKTEIIPWDGSISKQPLILNGKDYTTWRFVEETSRELYYWDKSIPEGLDYTRYDSPRDFFDKAIRHDDDRFSTITNSYNDVLGSFDNDILTDGINMELFLTRDNNVAAIVNYVYKDSPAYGSGLRRGSVITAVNGSTMNLKNYGNLLDLDECTYTYQSGGLDSDGEVTYSGREHTTRKIAKRKCKIDPVLMATCGEYGGRRYGYMVYDAFTQSTSEIKKAIATFQESGISDLILDLRLNGGGYASTLDTLASMLVPEGNVGKVFLTTEYNDNYTDYYRQELGSDFNKERFVKVSPRLSLSNIYVLMSGNTASASEELISGLMPYINIVTIGSRSYGKYTTNVLINNDMDGTDDDGIPYRSWAEYCTIGVCRNSLGEMNFKDGFEPDFPVFDDMACELGDMSEPLLQKALELMGGSIAKKAISPRGISHGKKIGSHGKPDITKGAMVVGR